MTYPTNYRYHAHYFYQPTECKRPWKFNVYGGKTSSNNLNKVNKLVIKFLYSDMAYELGIDTVEIFDYKENRTWHVKRER